MLLRHPPSASYSRQEGRDSRPPSPLCRPPRNTTITASIHQPIPTTHHHHLYRLRHHQEPPPSPAAEPPPSTPAAPPITICCSSIDAERRRRSRLPLSDHQPSEKEEVEHRRTPFAHLCPSPIAHHHYHRLPSSFTACPSSIINQHRGRGEQPIADNDHRQLSSSPPLPLPACVAGHRKEDSRPCCFAGHHLSSPALPASSTTVSACSIMGSSVV
ncbi:hypothetical protein Dimus_008674 [Dionaea muscipula]